MHLPVRVTFSTLRAQSEKPGSPSALSLFGEMKLSLLLLATMEAAALVISPAVIHSPRTVNSHIAMSTYGERLVSSHAQLAIRHTHPHTRVLLPCPALAAEYMRSRGMAAPTMVPAPVATPMTSYAEYMQSRGMPTAPIVSPSSVATFENYMKSRGMADSAPIAAPAAARGPSFEEYMKTRGTAAPSASIAAEPIVAITPKAGTSAARIPWGSDLAICEFVVDGVKRRYRIVQ